MKTVSRKENAVLFCCLYVYNNLTPKNVHSSKVHFKTDSVSIVERWEGDLSASLWTPGLWVTCVCLNISHQHWLIVTLLTCRYNALSVGNAPSMFLIICNLQCVLVYAEGGHNSIASVRAESCRRPALEPETNRRVDWSFRIKDLHPR